MKNEIHVIEDIGKKTHSFIVDNARRVKNTTSTPRLSTIEELHGFVFECYTPLHRFLYSLSSGETLLVTHDTLRWTDEIEKLWQSFLAVSISDDENVGSSG
jgi:hypothetical protein